MAMTDGQIEELKDYIRKRTAEVKADPSKAIPTLQRAGIVDAQGRVLPRYAGIVDLMRADPSAAAD